MNLLQFEFTTAPEDSINGLKGQLVKQLRYYTSKVPIEQLRAASPTLKNLEKKIQDRNKRWGLKGETISRKLWMK